MSLRLSDSSNWAQSAMDSLASPSLARSLAPVLKVPLVSSADAISGLRPNNVLVIRLDGIGDWILTSPLLRELRRALPHAHIAQIVRPAVFELARHCEYVDETLVFEPRTKHRVTQGLEWQVRALRLCYRTLWKRNWDVAIVPRWDFDMFNAAMLAFLSRASYRIGYSEHVSPGKAKRNTDFDRLFTHPIVDTKLRHERLRALGALAPLGIVPVRDHTQLTIPKYVKCAAEACLEAEGADDRLRIVVAPGAGHSKRVWPARRFAGVIERLAQERSIHVVLIGAPDDEGAGAEIEAGISCSSTNLIGQANLESAAGFIAVSDFLLGNDSGPMHIGCALGIPVVVVSCHPRAGDPSSNNAPERFGPIGDLTCVVRPESTVAPCVDACRVPKPHCILGVTVDMVVAATRPLLKAVLQRKAS